MRTTRFFAALALCAALPTLASAAPVKYDIDTAHSSIIFKVRHMNVANFYGAFKDFKGSITYDKDAPEASSLEITIDANSIDTRNSKRDDHIKSPDLLNAKQYPEISFKSTSVKKIADNNFEVAGQFTVHGVTKPLTVKLEKTGEAKNPRGGEIIGGETSFTFKRSEYGMTGMAPNLGDDITVTVAIEGKTAAE